MKKRVSAVVLSLVIAASSFAAPHERDQQQPRDRGKTSIRKVINKVIRAFSDLPTPPKPCDPNTQTCP